MPKNKNLHGSTPESPGSSYADWRTDRMETCRGRAGAERGAFRSKMKIAAWPWTLGILLCACNPYAEAMLLLSESLKSERMILRRKSK